MLKGWWNMRALECHSAQKNVPATFQRIMDNILRDTIGIKHFVYLDDIDFLYFIIGTHWKPCNNIQTSQPRFHNHPLPLSLLACAGIWLSLARRATWTLPDHHHSRFRDEAIGRFYPHSSPFLYLRLRYTFIEQNECKPHCLTDKSSAGRGGEGGFPTLSCFS